MYEYQIITTDAKLYELLSIWKGQGVVSIALDFEGEYNLHIYGEHLCLLQIFDRTSYYLLDPFSLSCEALKTFLETDWLEKVMFDCTGDAALVRKNYGIALTNVYDVRLPVLAFGREGGLDAQLDYFLGIKTSGKKKNQMTNWLRRPLHESQITYALSDVEHLFALKHILEEKMREAGIEAHVLEQMKTVTLPKNPERPGWEKLPGYRYLSRTQQVRVKHFYIARDILARQENVPAVRILAKQLLVQLAKNPPRDEQTLRKIIQHPQLQIESQLLNLMLKAMQDAEKEIKGDVS